MRELAFIDLFNGNEKLCQAIGSWNKLADDFRKVRIPTKTFPTLTIPAKKTKIYGYLEALLGETRSQKELIKESNRNYETPLHWNLEAEYMKPLKEFLVNNIKQTE